MYVCMYVYMYVCMYINMYVCHLPLYIHIHTPYPQVSVLNTLPLRMMSRAWGSVHAIELPVPLRAPLYNLWTYLFDCKLDEMRDPIDSYTNLSKFFTRKLKEGVRPIDPSSALVSE
jgi:phosphatidylserine decarboxylase